MDRTSVNRLPVLPILLVVLLTAAVLRFYGLDWDEHLGAHPDERYIVDVATRLSFPDGLNPFDSSPHYSYGHLPLYLLALGHLLAPGVDPLLVGRALSASFDLGTVALTYVLGRRVYDESVGLLAAALVGLMVAHVQQAHFYTPDVLLTFFVVATLLFAVRFAQDGRALDIWLAGVAAGLALGTKVSAAILVIPLLVACWSLADRPKGAAEQCALAAVLTFLAVDPYATVDLPAFLSNVREQTSIVRGVVDVPYTRQYHRTIPYFYPILQQLRWGMGWTMGSCALAGVVHGLGRAIRRPPRLESSVLLTWVLPFFAFIGGHYAKFPRYLLPILPLLAIYAGHLIADLGRWQRLLPFLLSAVVFGSLMLRCLALARLYGDRHPWIVASAWFYEHAEPGAAIAIEAWDHPLPLDATAYVQRELPIFEEETPEKWRAIDRALEEADYLVIASRRGYASLTRWSTRYRRTARSYQRLFAGDLGYQPVACFGRHPRLGPLVLIDDPTAGMAFSLPDICRPRAGNVIRLGRLDESFVVYDHPQVIIFEAIR